MVQAQFKLLILGCQHLNVIPEVMTKEGKKGNVDGIDFLHMDGFRIGD